MMLMQNGKLGNITNATGNREQQQGIGNRQQVRFTAYLAARLGDIPLMKAILVYTCDVTITDPSALRTW